MNSHISPGCHCKRSAILAALSFREWKSGIPDRLRHCDKTFFFQCLLTCRWFTVVFPLQAISPTREKQLMTGKNDIWISTFSEYINPAPFRKWKYKIRSCRISRTASINKFISRAIWTNLPSHRIEPIFQGPFYIKGKGRIDGGRSWLIVSITKDALVPERPIELLGWVNCWFSPLPSQCQLRGGRALFIKRMKIEKRSTTCIITAYISRDSSSGLTIWLPSSVIFCHLLFSGWLPPRPGWLLITVSKDPVEC